MQLLDGKSLSQKILSNLQSTINNLKLKPRLDIILVGNDPASLKYVAMKQKKGQEIGVAGELHHFETATTQQLIDKIIDLNNNPAVTALMVQLPLPQEINTPQVLLAIAPRKDADGLNPNTNTVSAATPTGIMKLLSEYKIELKNKTVVIINDSPVVGLPLQKLAKIAGANVVICNDQTFNLRTETIQADILISATGVKNLITADMVKEGSVVIDVGGGDVDFASVAPKCSFITPTFGGVGPMTVASLLYNTVNIATHEQFT